MTKEATSDVMDKKIIGGVEFVRDAVVWHSACGLFRLIPMGFGQFRSEYRIAKTDDLIRCCDRGGKKPKRFSCIEDSATGAIRARQFAVAARKRRAADRAKAERERGLESLKQGLKIDISNLMFHRDTGRPLDLEVSEDVLHARDNVTDAVVGWFGGVKHNDVCAAALATHLLLQHCGRH